MVVLEIKLINLGVYKDAKDMKSKAAPPVHKSNYPYFQGVYFYGISGEFLWQMAATLYQIKLKPFNHLKIKKL